LAEAIKLSEAGWRVYAVDLPGFGRSQPGGGSSRTWLRELFDRLGLESEVVVSPSMSGQYALPLATEEHGRGAGFVAVAPVGLTQYRERLGQITAPVLAVWGEHDGTVPLAHARAGLLKQGIQVAHEGPSGLLPLY
jgi:pimeloyl-ACP methyl ester carboxylesterase